MGRVQWAPAAFLVEGSQGPCPSPLIGHKDCLSCRPTPLPIGGGAGPYDKQPYLPVSSEGQEQLLFCPQPFKQAAPALCPTGLPQYTEDRWLPVRSQHFLFIVSYLLGARKDFTDR